MEPHIPLLILELIEMLSISTPHLLSTGVEAMKVMRMGGWNDLKTFQIYLRMSGVDVKGISKGLDVIPALDITRNVIPLFS